MAEATVGTLEPEPQVSDTPKAEPTQTETQESQQGEVFDLGPYADKLVQVKVDGKEELVPLGELPNGYMRQAHFTRAQQDLAKQREEAEFGISLAAALERDPQGTIQYVSRVYGINLEGEESEESEEVDPQEERLRQVESRAEEIEAKEALRQAREEYSELSPKYGDVEISFDDLLQYAVENDAKTLDHAYRLYAADQIYEAKRSEREEADRKARDAKAKIPATGSSVAAGSSQPLEGEFERREGESSKDVLRRSLKAALKTHGVQL